MKEKEMQPGCFNEIFKKLGIKILVTESLQQIPEYAKFLKKLLKRKKYLEEDTIEVHGDCSVILQKALPPKVKDPGSFIIPCTFRSHKRGKTLINLGSSINLMLLTVLENIGGLEVKLARISLFMADGSTKRPYGMVEDVMVQTNNLRFLVDFGVLEMEENLEIPIILGSPFMKTAKVMINVDDGTIALKDQEEEVIFNVFNVEQQIQVKKNSRKDACKDAPGTSTKASKPSKKENEVILKAEMKSQGDGAQKGLEKH
ncbi:uncharacterized protein LOC106770229 [Vigna radiata var. radiata]|uniref:Uncharacterized protein LOC106770229 n=1 Tax=Vigna radiata var. radiata TaxID=3916 RepID=A0A1S3UZM6_VIGRR|nr:uncharacterized protein LOC106770229 [Vigna radiata var. radiata]